MEIAFPVIYFISILISVGNNKSAKIFSSVILLILLCIFLGWSNTADLRVYEWWYTKASEYTPIQLLFDWPGKDRGYAFYNSIVAYIGFSFEGFHALLAIIYIIVLVKFIRKFTKEILLVLLLYILWPFFIDTIQLRTAIVHLMIFISLYFFSKKDKKSVIISVLMALLATTVHMLAYAYLPFFIFYIFHKNKVVTAIILLFSILMPTYITPLSNALSGLINAYVFMSTDTGVSTFSAYDLGTSNLGKYAYWIIVNGWILLTFLMRKCYKTEYQNIKDNNKFEFNLNYFEVCYAFALYLAIFLPLYGMTGAELGRIPRCFTLSFIVALVIFMKSKLRISYQKRLFIVIDSIFVLGLFGAAALYYNIWDSFQQILIENSFLDFIGL